MARVGERDDPFCRRTRRTEAAYLADDRSSSSGPVAVRLRKSRSLSVPFSFHPLSFSEPICLRRVFHIQRLRLTGEMLIELGLNTIHACMRGDVGPFDKIEGLLRTIPRAE